ncbi:hypothetical protein B566_EDAN004189 [Ephemera danica]|nr:hypothetical protein B566_EDAN004189 [Ephemera danica]
MYYFVEVFYYFLPKYSRLLLEMLAERRSKVKYIIVNPRKCSWSADESNFGRRLMQQMGWSDGKGLGREEMGSTEPVKVSYKNDSKAELNDTEDAMVTNPNTSLPTSLEKRSESSRSRLHYQKFTRGKDLSRYTEKDLACIVGKGKAMQPEPVEELEEGDDEETSFGVQTTKGGLIGDYFKKKMQALKLGKPPLSEVRMDQSAENIDGQVDSENKFEKKEKKRKILSVEEIQDPQSEDKIFKKSKNGKRKKKNACENPKEEIIESGTEMNLDDASDMKKKKRKKNKKKLSTEGEGCDNNLKPLRVRKRKFVSDPEEKMSNIPKRNKKQKHKM